MEYITPEITVIPIDYEISLVLSSDCDGNHHGGHHGGGHHVEAIEYYEESPYELFIKVIINIFKRIKSLWIQ